MNTQDNTTAATPDAPQGRSVLRSRGRFAPSGLHAPFSVLRNAGAPALAFQWQTEVSAPKPFRARAFHGESFPLACTPTQYAKPLTGLSGAAVALRWQTDGMDPDEWYEAPGAYDPATGELSAAWSPDCDTGADRVRFFLALETPGGASFRAFGTLDLAPSPGFTPAQRLPESQLDKLRDALADETQARQQADNALETALQVHTKRCVPLLAPGEHADPDTHGKTALVTQNGTQGGFAVSGQAGADPDSEAYVTRYQCDAITAFGADETVVERYLIGPQARNQDDAILRIGDLAATKPVTVTPESVGYVQKVTLALQIDRDTLAHAAVKDAIDWVPSSKAVKAALDQKAEKTHTHTTAQVTGLDAKLNAKADAAHTHTTAQVAGLDAALAQKANSADVYPKAQTYTKAEVDGKVAGVYHYKGSVANRAALPSAPAVGDVYNVQDEDGQNVAWTGSAWDALGATVDLSAYSTAEQTNAAIQANIQQAYNALSTATAQAIAAEAVARNQAIAQAVAPKANSADVYPKAQTYTKSEVDAAIAAAVAAAKTQLLAQIEGLYAPLSSVQATAGGVTYRWGWDDTFQTFAMKPVED